MRCSDDGTHRLGVNALAIHDASGRMITAGRDADIRVWRTTEVLRHVCGARQKCFVTNVHDSDSVLLITASCTAHYHVSHMDSCPYRFTSLTLT